MGVKKDKKVYESFYLEKSIDERINQIINDPNNIFDDKSSFFRYCIKQQLPKIEEEINEKK